MSIRRFERGQSVVEFALVMPIMLILLVGIFDLARIYTTIMSVESAAREAADYGTTLGAGKWQVGAPMDGTVAEMNKRACVAAKNLPDYVDPDGDPSNGCTNPNFAFCVTPSVGGTCSDTVKPEDACDDPLRPTPCTVTVTLAYEFHLLAPMNFEFYGTQFGLPSTLTFERNSTFAMTDIAAP